MTFGYGVTGHLYYPNNTPAGTRLPAVIWLHGYSYPLGYMWVYRSDPHPILALVNAGYAVLAFDQAGFGSRMGEFAPFYKRHPHWSLMGRMVEDTTGPWTPSPPMRRSIRHGSPCSATRSAARWACTPPRSIRGSRAWSRSAGSRRCAPTRRTAAPAASHGTARSAPLLPRLGFFIGHESRLPYDFDELIAAIAPRSVLVVEPTMDRATAPAEVRQAVTRARQVYTLYSAADKLTLHEPVDYTRLTSATQDRAVRWLSEIHAPSPVR